MAMPLARDVLRDVAVQNGACIRPVQLRRRNLDTGEVDQVLVPCGHTLAKACPACAERNKNLRASQCREGWHLEDEPDITPPARPARTRSGGSRCAPKPSSTATRPPRPGTTPPTLTSSSASWTPRSPRRASAAKLFRPSRYGGTVRPAARTPPTYPAASSPPASGMGTAGSLLMLTYPDIAETTGRPSLDYLPGTLVKP
jgi:hypothetical protein